MDPATQQTQLELSGAATVYKAVRKMVNTASDSEFHKAVDLTDAPESVQLICLNLYKQIVAEAGKMYELETNRKAINLLNYLKSIDLKHLPFIVADRIEELTK
jgi:hypothetical protein